LQESCIAGVRQAAAEEIPFGQCTTALGMLQFVQRTCQTSQLKCSSGCHSSVPKPVLFIATVPFETEHCSLCQECTNSVHTQTIGSRQEVGPMPMCIFNSLCFVADQLRTELAAMRQAAVRCSVWPWGCLAQGCDTFPVQDGHDTARTLGCSQQLQLAWHASPTSLRFA